MLRIRGVDPERVEVRVEVVAAGEGKWDEDGKKRIPMDVKKGDRVIYGKYAGTEYKTTDGDELLILPASEILAAVAN